ncbi:hypothetical protein N9909_00620 [bacterium]|nr:hypothetical protein [bacterium]
MPSGEYRDGQNIQVSKSEGEDVGALENAVGNILAVDFSVESGLATGTLKSIGILADPNSSNIFVFLTDQTLPRGNANDPQGPQVNYDPNGNNYIYSYNTQDQAVTKIVQGAFLNFSQSSPIYGINLLENLLFWTDNRNQPRVIELRADSVSFYNSEDLISVAKYNPYQAIQLYYQDGATLTPGGATNPNLNAYVSSIQDVTSELLPNGAPNMYYDQNWPGDPDYLEDKFVTFSYRFRFSSGEYSIMAPFTQAAFIPKQDGYFLANDEDNAYRSTIVRFMENKANKIGLYIPLPFEGNQLERKLNVIEIDVLYKESDSLAVKVLDSISASDFNKSTTSEYLYDYQSRKPYKTLPESEIIRVYDKVPVRALGQEITGNRVVYSNFQDKHTPPSTIDYDVAVTEKSNFSTSDPNAKASWTTSSVEYPQHNIKQNRSYQVGFILSDRYGRQSSVILSPVNPQTKVDAGTGITFGGSTFYHEYTKNPVAPILNNIESWPGDSIKVLINEPVEFSNNEFDPGLYNGDVNSDGYNPLGWYSYKIVVKQTEQEYYNVYLPGILDGYPNVAQAVPAANPDPVPDPQGTIAHITLIGDNINKVPRNLTEVGPEQKQYGSEVQLFGRVSPNRNAIPTFTEPYYPQANSQTVVTISEQNNLFDATPPVDFATVYQTETNPYVARISQNNVSSVAGTTLPPPIGSLQATSVATDYKILLGVFETAPVQSLLDIFWETSTSGLITELNAISETTTTVEGFGDSFIYTQSEASGKGAFITEAPFAPAYIDGLSFRYFNQSTVTLDSVMQNGLAITEDFIAPVKIPGGVEGRDGVTATYDRWDIAINNPLPFYIKQLYNKLIFNFSIEGIQNGVKTTLSKSVKVNIANEVPSITSNLSPISVEQTRDTQNPIATFKGVNGAVNPLNTYNGLIWSIKNQTPSTPEFEIDNMGNLYARSSDAAGSYTFDVVLEDNDGGSGSFKVSKRIDIVFGKSSINTEFGSGKGTLSQGLTSAGIFWGSYSNQSLVQSTPSDSPFLSSGSDGIAFRAVTESLVIDLQQASDTLVGNAKVEKQVELDNVKDDGGNKYKWKNINYRPNGLDLSLSNYENTSLTKGTAYIKVDFKYGNWFAKLDSASQSGAPGDNIMLSMTWLAYVQYRATPNATWVTATDIEGKEMRFGRSQENIIGLNRSGGENNFFNTGFITNADSSNEIITSPQGGTTNNAAAGSHWDKEQRLNPGAIVSKVFAFGEDQVYNVTDNNKLGEYRILVKYPQSTVTEYQILPTSDGANYVIQAAKQDGAAENLARYINVDVEFGDFYYKKESAFSYLVDDGNGSSTAAAASGITPLTELWAKEWSMKYVTQMYQDAGFTKKWTPKHLSGGNLWHSYQSIGTRDEIKALGTENSWIGENNELVNNVDASAGINLNDKQADQQRWVAQFDSNGKKIAGTAQPSNANIT